MLRKQIDTISTNDEDFDLIYSILMESPQTRDEFFNDPEFILKKRGIVIDPKVIDTIKRISILNIDGDRMDFNEKLVLCSSSGY